MFYVDQFVYTNKMRASHPLEKFAFALCTMIICLLGGSPVVHFVVMGVMLGLLVFRAKIPKYVILKLLMIPLGFLVIGVAAIAVFFSSDNAGMLISFKLGHYYFGMSKESLQTAGGILLQSLSCVTCLYFLALTVPMVELIFVLQSFRLPVVFTELMILIYRVIFVFIETAFSIYTAQSSRWGYCNFKRSIYSFGILFANLWGKVFLKSQALFNSLLSRGYEGQLKVLNPQYKFSLKNVVYFVLIDLVIVIIAFF